ncbi:hypothetical protein [Pseudovibrio sp. Alg231-02]|uniref:hypothetical protein n=1 Tax=Pseudovibrio sp. Alg231-02 TaxID=1922223 RepID=UPI000D553D71|nr:hypothetical protein [Pseudovibrio sp. Alg231-02]
MSGTEMPSLEPTAADDIKPAVKAVASLTPFVGGAIAEYLDTVIRDRRSDRIEAFIQMLEKRVSDLEINIKDLKLEDSETHIIQEGFIAASRTPNRESIEQIARVVFASFKSDESTQARNRLFMRLLNTYEVRHFMLLERFHKQQDIQQEAAIKYNIKTLADLDKAYVSQLVADGMLIQAPAGWGGVSDAMGYETSTLGKDFLHTTGWEFASKDEAISD